MPCETPSRAGHDLLACPVCGGTCVHPVRVTCVSPGRARGAVTIDAHGVAIDPHREPIGRGVWIAVAFGCENGHLFERQFQFHKGSTVVDTVVDARSSPEWATIWRE
jgi:hypothetical protein